MIKLVGKANFHHFTVMAFTPGGRFWVKGDGRKFLINREAIKCFVNDVVQ